MHWVGGSQRVVVVHGGTPRDQPAGLTVLACEEVLRQRKGPGAASGSDGPPEFPPLVGPRALQGLGAIRGWKLVPMDGHFTLKHKPAKGVLVLSDGGRLQFVDFRGFESITLATTALERSRLVASGLFQLPDLPPLVQSAKGRRGGKGGAFSRGTGGAAQGEEPPHEYGLPIRAITQARVMEKGGTEQLRLDLYGGGTPAEETRLVGSRASHMLATAHQDGFVRLFDARMAVPGQVGVVPNPEEKFVHERRKKMGAAVAVDLCLTSGKVAVGHDNGEVRFYRWSDSERTRPAMAIHKDLNSVPLDSTVYQQPGWQFHFISTAHRAPVTCLSFSSALGMMVAGDQAGFVSLTDCGDEPEVLFVVRAMSTATQIRSVRFLFLGDLMNPKAAKLPEPTYAHVDMERDPFTLRALCRIAVLTEEGAVGILDLAGATVSGKEGRFVVPKHKAEGLAMHPIDRDG